ncbi:hypothetical protein [Roseibium sp.]|uniref:hypothetical protein n=1 Tax=Roseibium sp. TaxID=1936156 RepID=UPI003B50D7ED
MKSDNEPGYLVFEAFALEVYRQDPASFSTALDKARNSVVAALKQCSKEDLAGLKVQLQVADNIFGLVGLMELMGADRPEDLPDVSVGDYRL